MKADSEWDTQSTHFQLLFNLHFILLHLHCTKHTLHAHCWYAFARHLKIKNLTRMRWGKNTACEGNSDELISFKTISEVNVWFLQDCCRHHRYCVTAFHIFFRLAMISWLFWEFWDLSRTECKWGQWLEFGMTCSLQQSFLMRTRYTHVVVRASQQAEVNTNQIRRSRELGLCLPSRGRVADF